MKLGAKIDQGKIIELSLALHMATVKLPTHALSIQDRLLTFLALIVLVCDLLEQIRDGHQHLLRGGQVVLQIRVLSPEFIVLLANID